VPHRITYSQDGGFLHMSEIREHGLQIRTARQDGFLSGAQGAGLQGDGMAGQVLVLPAGTKANVIVLNKSRE
jgi:hypothetical protein